MSKKLLLLLSSSRVYGYDYLEHDKKQIINLLEKRNVKTVLFVPYALKDHDKYTQLVKSTLEPWGYNVLGLHTFADPVRAIRSAEAIFVGGGNTFVLLKALYEKNLTEVMWEQVAQQGTPYIGSSAGTNVATRSIHTTNDMPMALPPTLEALNLVPFNINPHYLETDHGAKHKGETRDERILEFLEYYKLPVLGLREGSSLLVQGDKAVLLGDHSAKLFRYEQDPIELAPNSDLSFLLKL